MSSVHRQLSPHPASAQVADDRDSPLSILAPSGSIFSAFIDRGKPDRLQGNDAAKRFVDELNRAEDALQNARKQSAVLEQQKNAAVDKLNQFDCRAKFRLGC